MVRVPCGACAGQGICTDFGRPYTCYRCQGSGQTRIPRTEPDGSILYYYVGEDAVPAACCSCGGPFHPATGHRLSLRLGQCARCAGQFFAWVVGHTSKKARRARNGFRSEVSFYEAAATSVKAKEG